MKDVSNSTRVWLYIIHLQILSPVLDKPNWKKAERNWQWLIVASWEQRMADSLFIGLGVVLEMNNDIPFRSVHQCAINYQYKKRMTSWASDTTISHNFQQQIHPCTSNIIHPQKYLSLCEERTQWQSVDVVTSLDTMDGVEDKVLATYTEHRDK